MVHHQGALLFCWWWTNAQRATAMTVLPTTKTPSPTPASASTQKIMITTPIDDDIIVKSPHIGYVNDPSNKVEVFIIGTSHFRCSSAAEVTSLITQVRPDGVILELDAERVLRLTKQYFGFDNADADAQQCQTTAAASSLQQQQKRMTQTKNSHKQKELLYGADFVAAVTTCQEMDIPLFLGDESAQETKNRLVQQLFNVNAYTPASLIDSLIPTIALEESQTMSATTTTSRIHLIDSFRADPKKLIPLAVSSSPSLFVSALSLLFHNKEAAASIAYSNSFSVYDGAFDVLETYISIVLSFFVSCFLFNTVIVERDEILADSTIRAWNVLRSLKDGNLIRKRWEFTVNNANNNEEKRTHQHNTLPLFTLKTPLVHGKRRNLNLFEQRWLNMIDSVVMKSNSPSSLTASPQFGCVRCENKFYSASSINGIEGRYADIIFERKGTIATIVDLKEGRRPSGDRKVGVTIEGGDEFNIIDESSNLSVTDDGYMIASDILTKTQKRKHSKSIQPPNNGKESKEWVRVVVVVGLLHGNGVVKLLSK